MKINNVLITIIVIVVSVGVYIARKNHSESNEFLEKVIKFNSSAKDSISILVSYIDVLKHDTARYRLMITQKDSTIRFYVDNKDYMQLVLNNKNKQITTISKNLSYDKMQCAKKLDSIINVLNGYERVHVPD